MIDFHKRLTELFGDRFIIKSEYKGMLKPINLYCSDCENIFTTLPKYVVRTKNPCSYCNNHQEPYTKEEWINICKQIHKNKYDYSETVYNGCKEMVTIKCPKHGYFTQLADNHLCGHGCKKCANEEKRKKALKIPNIPGYKILEYNGARYLSKILCEKHNIVFYQRTYGLKKGAACEECSKTRYIGEETIKSIFKKNNINYNLHYPIKNVKFKHTLNYDFYLPDYNLLIEYNGIQHYKKVNWDGKLTEEQLTKALKEQRHKDWLKRKGARENNIDLLIIPYTELNNIEEILKEKLNL